MQAFKRPVIPLVLSYMGGIGLGGHLTVSYIVPLVVVCISAPFIIWNRNCRKPLLLSPILILVASGYLSILPWVSPQFPAHHIVHLLNGDPVALIGDVVSRPYQKSGRTKFVFACRWLQGVQNRTKATGKIRVTLSDDTLPVKRGQTLELSGRLRAPKNYQNPGGFDFVRKMAYQQIWASLYTRTSRVQILKSPDRPDLSTRLDCLRADAAHWIETLSYDEQNGVLKALLIGDRSEITPELRQKFSRAGVSHILAISGLHIGIVATVAFTFFSWLLRQFDYILQRGSSRKWAAVLTLIPVIGYGLLAGMSPSTQRAVLMAVVFLAAFWVGRELDTFSSLAAAAGIILIVHPPALFSISFQLSFTAVFAILFGFSRIRPGGATANNANGANRVWVRIRRYLIGMAIVSVFAVWGTFPLTMFYFNQVSLIGIAANLIIVPVIGFLVVPLGLTALCFWPIWQSLAEALILISAFLLSWTMPVIDTFSNLHFASFTTWTPTVIEIVCFYSISLCALMMTNRESGKSLNIPVAGNFTGQKSVGSRNRVARFLNLPVVLQDKIQPKTMLWSVFVLSVLVLGADTLYWLNQRYWHKDLKITILDVGNGNAALIEFPGGRTFMLDGGGFADITAFDPGARVLAPYLRKRKIMTIDTLILSHPNSDHMNGLIYIANHFNVNDLWTNGEPRGTRGYKMLKQSALKNRIRTPRYKNIDRETSIGGVTVNLLYPPTDFLARRNRERWRNTNNNSLVVQLIHKDHSFLFPGDITHRAEAELVRICGSRLRSTVLVVPHHGSKTSSSPMFLSAVKPQIAIVSARDWGRRRHPHPTVIDRYHKRNCRLLFTEQQGAVRLISDGYRLRVEPFVKE